MPKMGVNPEQTKAPKPVPAGWYDLRVKGITAKLSKSGKGINYEAYTEVVNNTNENNSKFVPARMNNGFNQAMIVNDFVHSCGFVLEADGSIPGDWQLKPEIEAQIKSGALAADDLKAFDGAQYKGPLLGKVLQAEVTVYQYGGIDRNEIKQYRCKVQDCAVRFADIRHLMDVRGKK